MTIRFMAVFLALSCSSAQAVLAQSAPSGFATVVNLPSATDGTQFRGTIESDTQVNIRDGGLLSGESGNEDGTSSNIELNVYGGQLNSNFDAWSGTTINLLGGRIEGGLMLEEGSQLFITEGELGSSFRGKLGSYVEVSGGHIERNAVTAGSGLVTGGSVYLTAWNGGTVDYTGGTYLRSVALDRGIANIYGGFVGPASGVGLHGIVNIHGGVIRDEFHFQVGQLTLYGGEFRLDGEPVTGLGDIGSSVTVELGEESSLSGVLSDGMPFFFSRHNSNRTRAVPVNLVTSAIPAANPAVFVASQGAVPYGILGGQTLVVDEGASVTTDLELGWGSQLIVEAGGTVVLPFEQTLDGIHAQIDIAGGTSSSINVDSGSYITVRDKSQVPTIIAEGSSKVELQGGTIGNVYIFSGSYVESSGGERNEIRTNSSSALITDGQTARMYVSDSTLDLRGGSIGELWVRQSSDVNITGGTITDTITVTTDGQLNVHGGVLSGAIVAYGESAIDIFGSHFILDGIDITSSLEFGTPFTVTQRDLVLSAILEDGSLFEYELSARRDQQHPNRFDPNTLVRLVRIPEPNAMTVALGLLTCLYSIGERSQLRTNRLHTPSMESKPRSR